jgi:ribonuclease HI
VHWEPRYFKGDRVWVRLDDEGDYDLEDDLVPMRYDDDETAKIYHADPSNIAADEEEAEATWRSRLEARERDLDERERRLDARERALDDREAALDDWESRLKEQGIAELEERDRDDDREASTMPEVLRRPELSVVQGGLELSTEPPESIADLDPPAPREIEIHTDGACAGNPGPCGFGVVLRCDGGYLEMSGFLGQGTNNVAELTAIKAALESIDDRSRAVCLHTDSRYAIGVLVGGWNAKANRDLILGIRDLIESFDDLEFCKVEAHAGEALNERADDLAKHSIPD